LLIRGEGHTEPLFYCKNPVCTGLVRCIYSGEGQRNRSWSAGSLTIYLEVTQSILPLAVKITEILSNKGKTSRSGLYQPSVPSGLVGLTKP